MCTFVHNTFCYVVYMSFTHASGLTQSHGIEKHLKGKVRYDQVLHNSYDRLSHIHKFCDILLFEYFFV